MEVCHFFFMAASKLHKLGGLSATKFVSSGRPLGGLHVRRLCPTVTWLAVGPPGINSQTEYWSGVPALLPGILPDQGCASLYIPALQVRSCHRHHLEALGTSENRTDRLLFPASVARYLSARRQA